MKAQNIQKNKTREFFSRFESPNPNPPMTAKSTLPTKHTPGPWFVNGPWHIQAETRTTIPVIVAQILPLRSGDLPTREANAKLIAASPELLSALQLFLNAPTNCPVSLEMAKEAARAAIALATAQP